MSILAHHNAGSVPPPLFRKKRLHPVYAILHFGLNTYTDREWGFGDESPLLFNPASFDADAIAKACKAGGISGIIIVCKHHDGFCLWPTKTTPHNISASPWRGGKGDLVKEMADACRNNSLEVGFYVSPWDRNNPAYGTKEYLEIYREQLREVFTRYGEAFELWFDGANGGDGFYGGAREVRKIDAATYYDWENTWEIARSLQKDAAIFSDIGPELRWVGNERGFAHEEAFASYTPLPAVPGTEPAPGLTVGKEGMKGTSDGKYFIPFEADFPLRPGWFFHPGEEGKQKTSAQLLDIFFHSVGCGGFMNIGVSPDRNGVMSRTDCERLAQFGKALDSLFEKKVFECWLPFRTAPDGKKEALVRFDGTVHFNLLEMQEEMLLGESIRSYSLFVEEKGKWRKLFSGEAVGFRRLKKVKETSCDAVKIIVEKTTAWNPDISTLFLACYQAPAELLDTSGGKADGSMGENFRKLPAPRIAGNEAEWILPEKTKLKGFLFRPLQPAPGGTPTHYRIESSDGEGPWEVISQGEFANIAANPIPQKAEFPERAAKKLKITALRTLVPGETLSFGECGIFLP